MTALEPLSELLHEAVEIHATIELAKCRRADTRALAGLVDGMALTAHVYDKSAPMLRPIRLGPSVPGEYHREVDCQH